MVGKEKGSEQKMSKPEGKAQSQWREAEGKGHITPENAKREFESFGELLSVRKIGTESSFHR